MPPAVTRPHLVSNAERPLLVHDCVGVSEVARGEDDLTGTGRNALTDKGSNLAASSVSLCNGRPCRLCTVQVLAPAQNNDELGQRRTLATRAWLCQNLLKSVCTRSA